MDKLQPIPRPQHHPSYGRGLGFFCVILSLCISLASRTVSLELVDSPAVHSSLAKAKVQHLDKDAFEWTSPVAAFAVLLIPAARTEAVANEQAAPSYDVDTCLYNRPPPLA